MLIELTEDVGTHKNGAKFDVEDGTAKAYINAGKAKAVSMLPPLPAPSGTDGAAASGANLNEEFVKALVAETRTATIREVEGMFKATGLVRPEVLNALGNIGRWAEPREERTLGGFLKAVASTTPEFRLTYPGQAEQAFNRITQLYKARRIEDFGENYNKAFSQQNVAMMSRPDAGFEQKTVQSEVSGALGGFGIPIEFFPEIIKFAEQKSKLLAMVKKYPMTGLQMQVPALDLSKGGSGASPYLAGVVAGWFAEGGNVPTTNAYLRQMTLKANLLGMLTQATRTLVADNTIAFQQIMTELMGEAIGFYATYAILNGTGSDQPRGIYMEPATVLVTRTGDSSAGTTYADASNIQLKLLPGVEDQSLWMFAPSMKAKLLQINDASSRNMWLPNITAPPSGPVAYGGSRNRFLDIDYEVGQYTASQGSKGDLTLIYPMGYAWGQREEIEIAVSEHYAFGSNLLTWRGLYRADGKSRINTYLTLANGDTVSPFVIRNT